MKAKTKVLIALGAGALATAASLAEITASALYQRQERNHAPIITDETVEERIKNSKFLESLASEYNSSDWKPISDRLRRIESFLKKANFDDEQLRLIDAKRQDMTIGISDPYIQNSDDLSSALWNSLVPDLENFFKKQKSAEKMIHKADCNAGRTFNDASREYSERLFRYTSQAIGLYSRYGLDRKEGEKRVKSFFAKAREFEKDSPCYFIGFLDAVENNILLETLQAENL